MAAAGGKLHVSAGSSVEESYKAVSDPGQAPPNTSQGHSDCFELAFLGKQPPLDRHADPAFSPGIQKRNLSSKHPP